MFPFQFGKKLEYKCIWAENDDNGTWCSTDVDENGVHKPRSGNWGYCGPECPHADKPKAGMKFVVANVTFPTFLNYANFLYNSYET